MPLRETRGILALRARLQKMDDDLRKNVCPICGKPTGGIVFAGQSADSICTRADHVKRGEANHEPPQV